MSPNLTAMLRNWYAVYTKPQKEKLVSIALSKKGIENYCPLINVIKARTNKKTAIEPLFLSHVFVYLSESDLSTVKSIPGIVNFLYWKSKPAIIKTEEIDVLKHFIAKYNNIRLVKSTVNQLESIKFKDDPLVAVNEHTLSVKYQTVKVSLPSLGYIMIAERGTANGEPVYEEVGLFRTFPKKLNSFFFN